MIASLLSWLGIARDPSALPVFTPELGAFEHRLNRDEYRERNNRTLDMRAALETCRRVSMHTAYPEAL